MPFVKFTGPKKKYAARMSISPDGVIGFSDGTIQRYHLDEYTHCFLYFDPDTRRVGVEPTRDQNAPGARRFQHRANGSSVTSKSFLEFFNLRISQTTVYAVDKDDETGFLVIDLNTGTPRGTEKRRREART